MVEKFINLVYNNIERLPVRFRAGFFAKKEKYV